MTMIPIHTRLVAVWIQVITIAMLSVLFGVSPSEAQSRSVPPTGANARPGARGASRTSSTTQRAALARRQASRPLIRPPRSELAPAHGIATAEAPRPPQAEPPHPRDDEEEEQAESSPRATRNTRVWLPPRPLLDRGAYNLVSRQRITTYARPLRWSPRQAISEAQRLRIARHVARSSVHVDTSAGLGSGFVATPEGWIVTNHHVIAESDLAGVMVMADGSDTPVAAVVIAADPDLDIAILQPMRPLGIPALPLSRREPLPGHQVFAYGSPLGLRGTLSEGIISAIRPQDVSDGVEKVRTMVQTDTVIAPGNSGGALVDARGTLVGINSEGYGASENVGLNFAISAATLRAYIRDVRTRLAEARRPPRPARPEPPSPQLSLPFAQSPASTAH